MSSRSPIPPLSLLLGFGPVLLLAVAALAAWVAPLPWQGLALIAGWLWGAAILLFLAGVVRGLSFFSPGGPHAVQIGVSIWLFVLGLGALVTRGEVPFGLLLLGYLTVLLYDPKAARDGLAPAHFARLRPPQMAIAAVALLALFWRAHVG